MDGSAGFPGPFASPHVRCPDCRRTFRASRAAADHGTLTCPSCGNQGRVAPGNAPQLSDAEVGRLDDAQFETYLHHGFQVVSPAEAARPRWGSGPPAWSRAALASLLSALALWLVPGWRAAPGTRWMALGLLVAASVAAAVLGAVALRRRSGSAAAVAAALVLGPLSLAAAAGLAGLAYEEGQCRSLVAGAVWREPGAAEALRALGVRPLGDPAVRAPQDTMGVSALSRVGHAGRHAHYQAFFENGTWARVTVGQEEHGAEAAVRDELAAFIANLTGRDAAEAARLADGVMAGDPSVGIIGFGNGTIVAVSGSPGTVVRLGPGREGPVPGPFRTAELLAETGVQAPWGYTWDWAHVTGSLLLPRGAQFNVWGHGLASVEFVDGDDGVPEAAVRDAVRSAFLRAGLPEPTFEGFSARPPDRCL